MTKPKVRPYIGCTIKELPKELAAEGALEAVRQNPLNQPAARALLLPDVTRIAVTSTYFRSGGVDLAVWFMETTREDLQAKILSHFNAWGERCNVQFKVATSQATSQVRISRGPGGYWSFLGTDILSIPTNQPTMNLEGFRLTTPESEYRRVVRHEVGHTLGCPHEHARREIVDLLDPAKVIAYFGRTQGWSEREVRAQILTPLDERSIRGTPHAQQDSLMAYSFPGTVTKSGKPIPGGVDITPEDAAFMATIYQKVGMPPPPPVGLAYVAGFDASGKEIWRMKP